jgi:uncharacterized secreted protein with C-terminal beta-propeller domain
MIGIIAFSSNANVPNANGEIKTFTDYGQLSSFIADNTATARSSDYPILSFFQEQSSTLNGQSGSSVPATSQSEIGTSESNTGTTASDSYSTTNNQVQGVDEADMVKTDGNYLYIASGDTVYIVQAQPASNASVVSKILLNGSFTSDLYISNNRLVVITNEYYAIPLLVANQPEVSSSGEANASAGSSAGSSPSVVPSNSSQGIVISPPIMWEPPTTSIQVYDVTNKSSPMLVNDIEINGSFSGTRMIGDYVYAVIDQMSEPFGNSTVVLPTIDDNGAAIQVQPNQISYTDASATSYDFITVLALDIANDNAQPTFTTFLANSESDMYVAQDNMYLAVPNYGAVTPVADGLLGTTSSTDETLIYRLSLNGASVTLEAQGSVPGIPLDQYSMDESNGYFRIATTQWTDNGTVNNLYVLDSNLSIVGKIEGFAPGESIYSARFIDNRCYLITYQQVDPFYVIDLTDPTSPQILGALDIPGVSTYLYPYDANTIIGVGTQNENVMLSLFNVTDVSNPTQIATYQVDANFSYTDVAYDTHAFLYDQSRSLLVIPVTMESGTWVTDDTNDKGSGQPPVTSVYAMNWTYWQGVLVFNVSPENGFALLGNVTHMDSSNNYGYIERSLYIGNVLYTVSSDMVKLNDLNTLALLNEVDLS